MDRYISTPNTQELEQLGEIVCQCFASALSESESYLNRIGRENFRIITDGNQAMPSSGREAELNSAFPPALAPQSQI